MSSTVPERTVLGDAALNNWWLDVDTATTSGSATWTAVNAIYDFKDTLDTKTADVSDFNSDGWKDEQAVGQGYSIDFKVWRKNPRGGEKPAYDPGQEFLRLHAGKSVHVRWYEMSGDGTEKTGMPRVEAYEGYVSVKWSPDGGKVDDPKSVSVTLTGKGKRIDITHPKPNTTG